jgi:hypothetical protein
LLPHELGHGFRLAERVRFDRCVELLTNRRPAPQRRPSRLAPGLETVDGARRSEAKLSAIYPVEARMRATLELRQERSELVFRGTMLREAIEARAR